MKIRLSQFRLHPQEADRPYLIFDPKTDQEYDRLAKFINIDELEQSILTKGIKQLEAEGRNLHEPADWSGIYKVTGSDPEITASGPEFKIEKGQSVYVFIAIIMKAGEMKAGKFTNVWMAFLCADKDVESLYADQQALLDRAAGRIPRFGGPN